MENLLPGMSLDRRELEFRVVGIHRVNLLFSRRAQHLDNLHQLVDARLTGEQRLPQQQLSNNAARRPDVDGAGILSGSEDELGCPVVPGADI